MHECPRCGQACDCSGDWDDCEVMSLSWVVANCQCDCDEMDDDEDDEPYEWRCGGCDAYWFKEPNYSHCPFCHQDAIYPVYADEEYDDYPL